MMADQQRPKMGRTPSVDLVHDGKWKQIQQNTFTRWTNQHLKSVGMNVENLETDLSDGVKLIKLAEVLAGRHLPRYNHNPNMRTQKLDNVSLALKFLQVDEGIKLVNIDSAHIVDQNLKLIMGLVWTLILHYSISKPIPSSHTPTSPRGNGPSSAAAAASTTAPNSKPQSNGGVNKSSSSRESSPKQRLLSWIRSQLPQDVPITNFTSDWNDGVALGALLEACVPGSCAEWRSWSPNESLANTKKAMTLAEECLGVEGLITPEELTSPKVDEKSVMTYLAQYPQLKSALERRGRISGVDEFPIVGRRTHFFVDVENELLKPEVTEMRAGNRQASLHPLEVRIVQSPDIPTKYEVSFTPREVGKLKLQVVAKDVKRGVKYRIGNGPPLTVDVVPSPTISGLNRGESAKIELGQELKFRVNNTREESQHLAVLVKAFSDEDGGSSETAALEPVERVGNSLNFKYTPKSAGRREVHVLVNKIPIEGSPFPVDVTESEPEENADPLSAATIWGRGICPWGAQVGERLFVHVWDCAVDPVEVEVSHKDGVSLPVEGTANGANRLSYTYVPVDEGPHQVAIKADGHHVGESPYHVNVEPASESLIKAVGPGLEGGVVGRRSVFFVDTHGSTSALKFTIQGPSLTEINCHDNGDGSATVDYVPKSKGRYTINIIHWGKVAKGSPYDLMVEDADKSEPPIRVTAVDPSAHVGEPVHFSIDKESTGDPFDIVVYGPDLNLFDGGIEIHPTPDAYHYSFTPEEKGRYLIGVTRRGVGAEGWPVAVDVRDKEIPSIVLRDSDLSPDVIERKISVAENYISPKEELDGSRMAPKHQQRRLSKEKPPEIAVEGLVHSGVYAGERATFVVRADESGELAVNVSGEHKVEVQLTEAGESDGMFLVNYLARHPGRYKFAITFNKSHICGSPFEVLIKPARLQDQEDPGSNAPSALEEPPHNGDATRVAVDGGGLAHFMPGEPARFTVSTGRAGINLLYIGILTVNGPAEEVHVSHVGDGIYEVSYRVSESTKKAWVYIKYGESLVADSPFVAHSITE